MKTLHLKLHRKWFWEILSGQKKQEYRAMTEFWEKRLEGQTYDRIKFRNGYASNAPWMEVEFLGLGLGEWDGETVYAISLGEILKQGNLEWLKSAKQSPGLIWPTSSES